MPEEKYVVLPEEKYYEDLNIGYKFVSPAKTMTEAEIIGLTRLGGMVSPLWDDEEYAKTTQFKGRIAPGPVTLLVMLGLMTQTGVFNTDIGALGLNKVRWMKPLKAGDTIRCETEVIDRKETHRPDAGIIIHIDRCINQRGEVILELENVHLFKRRPIAQPG